MPPKSVTCSICSAEVLKAQTLARADGTRACRSHEGVADEAEKRLTAERAEREKHDLERVSASARERQSLMHVLSPDWEAEAAAHREYVYSHCWTCEAEGLEGREFFAQAMIAMKRLQMRGEFTLMGGTMAEDIRKLMGDVRLLMLIKLGTEVVDRAVVKHVMKRVREAAPFLGFVLLCPPCCDKHGFRQRVDDMMPKPTWGQVEAMLPVVAGMEPLLRVLAEKKERQS